MEDHTQTEAGLWIPANEFAETDGGKVTTRPSKQKYYSQGIIIAIGTTPPENLTVGDAVLIAKHALNSETFHFYTNRLQQVQEFKGLICVPHTLIEAKLN